MTDNKNTTNELNDEELDTVNGGFIGGLKPTADTVQSTKANPDLTNVLDQKLEIKVGPGNIDKDNLQSGTTPFNGKNPFNARFGLGKKFGKNRTKIDD